MGFVIDEPDSVTMSRWLSKLATQVSSATSPGAAWFAGVRLLVLVVGGPRLVNAILVTRLWAGPKVVSRLATILASHLTGESMNGFNLPSAVHDMDNIQIKSLRKISLDVLKGRFGFEVTEIDYGLVTEVFKKLERMSEVVVGSLGKTSKDIHCCI
jgi:hypothetical protein